MKIKVIQPFNDKENDFAFRDIGTVLEVTEQRGQFLIEKGYVEEITEPEQDQTAEKAPKPKRTSKKTEDTN